MTVALTRYRFSVDEYHQMVEAGVFNEDDPVELIEGEIVEMAPIGSRHAACVKKLNQLFTSVLGDQVIVSVQDPIGIGGSEPEPDIALLRPRDHFYVAKHPGPEDVLLVVEVADSSFQYDREVKMPLYARSGIVEAWLVDLGNDEVVVYREPSPKGYGSMQTYSAGDEMSLSAFDLTVRVDDVLLRSS